MGRPRKDTPDARKAIYDAIAEGASDKAAALCADIDESTFYRWLKDDESFARGVSRARAKAVRKAESLVFGGNPLTWLTRGPGRRFAAEGEAWTDANRVELTGADGGPIRSAGPDLSKLSTAELRTLRELTEKAEGAS